MAKLDPNTVIGMLQGKLGNLVFSRLRSGVIAVRRKPVRQTPATPNELANQSRFEAAARYVTCVRLDPIRYAPYQAAGKLLGRRACDLANADFRHPPEVREIDPGGLAGHAGDSLAIEATDDFEVARVAVVISTLDGAILEQGDAVPDAASGRWRYVVRQDLSGGQTVLVRITAYDRPGNVAVKAVHYAISTNAA